MRRIEKQGRQLQLYFMPAFIEPSDDVANEESRRVDVEPEAGVVAARRSVHHATKKRYLPKYF
jgi:hypothetical protein